MHSSHVRFIWFLINVDTSGFCPLITFILFDKLSKSINSIFLISYHNPQLIFWDIAYSLTYICCQFVVKRPYISIEACKLSQINKLVCYACIEILTDLFFALSYLFNQSSSMASFEQPKNKNQKIWSKYDCFKQDKGTYSLSKIIYESPILK